MPQQLTNDNGETVEVPTQEEIDAKINDAKAEAQKESEEKISALTQEIATLNEKINDGGDDKNKNFAQLREAKEAAEKKLAEIKGEVDTKIAELKNSLTAEKIDAMAEQLSGGDQKVKDKIKFHYDNFKGEPKDMTEIAERMKNAAILAGVGGRGGGMPAAIISAGAGYVPKPQMTHGGKIDEGSKEVAAKLGIKEEELKKHNLI